mmetsp:Transcript_32638/g.88428  ORF Transcript_32638/g.88428 Transcript_32638/m.88428 type:complete len:184 (-) Transcript_32638:45-596(-)
MALRTAVTLATVLLLPMRATARAFRRDSHAAAAHPAVSANEVHAEVPFRRDGALTITTEDSREVVVDLEVPDSYQTFMQGLMYRSSFCEKCSMLFAWDEDGDRPFWMKDTWIPLDLVWVNHDKVIVDIKQARADDTTSVGNDRPAQYVFEFRKDWCADHGVKVGDTVSWRHESPRSAFSAMDS